MGNFRGITPQQPFLLLCPIWSLILSGKFLYQLPLFGKGRSSAVFNAILSLKVNEALIITKAEWKPKYPPTKIVTRIEQRFKMKFIRGALPDRSGWAVKRIK